MRFILLAVLLAAPGAASSQTLEAHCRTEASSVKDPAANLKAYMDCMAGKTDKQDYSVAAPKPSGVEPMVKFDEAKDPNDNTPEAVRNTVCAVSTDEKVREARDC